jgi:hypothetical protein
LNLSPQHGKLSLKRGAKMPQEETPEVTSEPDIYAQELAGPVKWVRVHELPVFLADQLWVQATESQITLTFGRTEMPFELMSTELAERVRQEGIEVSGVSRISISPQSLGRFATVLSRMHDQYQQESGIRSVQ